MPGLERADSVTIDPHKWFFQAYDIGALIVRRREDLLTAFHRAPEYYRSNRPEDEPLHWYQYSMEGTRRFRALKLWMSWKHLGTEGLGHLIEQNDDLAAYLAERCAEADDFEANPAVPELSVVCFRHLPDALDAVARRRARRLPDPAPARAGGERGGMGQHHDAARPHVSARRGRELPQHAEDDVDRLLEHPAGGSQKASSKTSTCADAPGPSSDARDVEAHRARAGPVLMRNVSAAPGASAASAP